MIISRTPLRVSFVGGGSDLPAFCVREPGAVVSTTVNKYIYITVNKKFDDQIRASYSITEFVDEPCQLKHELIREALILLGINGGIEITSISDIPSRGTGLGSSSTYTVGLLNALYAYKGEFASAERLASEACRVEIELCGKTIGKQDQYAAAYGGLNYIQFNPDGSVFVDPIICNPETKRRLEGRFLMLYTGLVRNAVDVLEHQSRNITSDEIKRQSLSRMVGLAQEMRDALRKNDLSAFGELLHQNWLEKRTLANSIGSARIDEWYDTARASGALGGKILGAGGGGFLLLYAPKSRHRAIIKALPELKPVGVELEPQGSKIIYVEE
jgi:D-glycero-alpha-D-manno-heptose-7-phosphate kinase